MTEVKIRRSIYILIGLTILILIGMSMGWLFVLARPQQDEIAIVEKKYNERKVVALTLTQNLKAQRIAEDKQRYVEGQLAFFRGSRETNWLGRYRTFEFKELADPASETAEQRALRINVWKRQLNEYFSSYGENLQGSLLRRANAIGPLVALGERQKLIISFPGVKVDAPPKAPEDVVVPANALLKPTAGTGGGSLGVSVKGTFRQIKEFLNQINREPILYSVGNIKLEGVSPEITATFSITPYLLATGDGAQKLSITPAAPAGDAGTGAPGMGDGTATTTTPTAAPTA